MEPAAWSVLPSFDMDSDFQIHIKLKHHFLECRQRSLAYPSRQTKLLPQRRTLEPQVWFGLGFCQLPALQLWTNYLITPYLSFLISHGL
jgi:hypothetical protein